MASNPSPTKNQQKAIDGSGSLLISAAAGSGKTATLVNRVIKKLTDPLDMFEITDFLLVTFTVSAAAEMRSRISQAVSEKLSEDISPALRRHLTKQTVLLAKADISTVDAFCKKLITDNFDRLGLAPDFKMISEPRLELLKQQALSDTVEYFLLTKKKEFTALMKLLGTDSRLENIKSAISAVYDYMRTLPFPDEWKQKCIDMYEGFSDFESSPWGKFTIGRIADRLNNTVDMLQSTLNDISRDSLLADKRGGDLSVGLNNAVLILKSLCDGDFDTVRRLSKKEREVKWSGKITAKDICDPYLKQKCETAKSKYNALLSQIQVELGFSNEQCRDTAKRLTPFIRLLFEATDYYSGLLAQRKKEKNALDFADIEHLTLKLLAKREGGKTLPTEFALSLSQSFREILVDEYQDTNDLQDEIFRIISCDRSRLFCVGDVKQSIYGFRRSNPKNFISMMESYPDYEEHKDRAKIILSENFRSRKGICDTVNFIFRRIMSKKVGDIDYNDDHSLFASAQFPKRDIKDVQIDIIDISDNDERTVIQIEADRIAEIIEDMMQKECITDKSGLRRPEYGDFCILLRTAKNTVKPLADRLFEHGIPAVYSHSDDFFDIPEVSKMMAILKVISNPLDDVSLLSAMMSPVFGFTADDIGQLCVKKGGLSIYAAVCKASENGDQKARQFLKQLSDLRRFSATHTAERLISEIYETTGLPEIYLTCDDGERKRQNLNRLLNVARDCADEGYETVYEFLRFSDLVKRGDIKLSSEATDSSSGGVIIKTIHNSKGLQFPVVFVIELSKRPPNDTSAFKLDQDYGIGLKVYDPKTRTKTATPMFEAVKQAKKISDISERLRIYYVAATRPKDNLFIINAQKGAVKRLSDDAAALCQDFASKGDAIDPVLVEDCTDFGRLINYCALLHPAGKELRSIAESNLLPETDGDTDGVEIGFINSCDINPSEQNEPSENAPSDSYDKDELDRIKEQLSFEYKYKSLAKFAAKVSVSSLTHKGPSHSGCTLRPAFLKNERLNTAEKGTAMHEFMQYADYLSAETDLENEISLLKEQEFLSSAQADSLDRQKLAAFFSSNLFSRIKNSEKFLREQRFIIDVPASELDGTLPPIAKNEVIAVQGIADCIFFEEGKAIIVDYKTDRVSDEQTLRDRYSAQLELYAKAFERILSVEIKQKIIYSFYMSKEIIL